jgi:agmatinase
MVRIWEERPYEARTFAGATSGTFGDIVPGEAVILGVPYDRTKISRAGAAEGPAAIRESTAMFQFAVTQMAGGAIADLESNRALRYRPRLRDLGDLDVSGAEVGVMFEMVRSSVHQIVRAGGLPVVLGGDHYLTFPSATAVAEALDAKQRMAYLHFDMHLDMAGDIPYWGSESCGAPIRRLVDTGVLDGRHAAVIGAGSFQHQNEVAFAAEHGIRIYTSQEVRTRGAATVVGEALEAVMGDARVLYVTIDIDCLNRTFAPGTGNNVGIGGLLPEDLLESLQMLRAFPVAAIDMAEVAPRWDPTGRTPAIAANLLIEFLEPYLYEVEEKEAQS